MIDGEIVETVRLFSWAPKSLQMVTVKVTQLCLTLCSPMDYMVHGTLQARILEWVAIPFSRASSQPRDRSQVSCIAGGFFTRWATREAHGSCSHEIKTLTPWKTSYENLHSMWKSRGITLPTKVHLVKAIGFPIVMYGSESWTIKKTKHWRTDAFELGCWKRLLRVIWIARKSNKFILKEISPDHSLEGLMPKLQYFGHLRGRTDSLEKTLMLGKIEGRRRRGRQRMRQLDGITNLIDMSLSKF